MGVAEHQIYICLEGAALEVALELTRYAIRPGLVVP
jgi:hypothetical protein